MRHDIGLKPTGSKTVFHPKLNLGPLRENSHTSSPDLRHQSVECDPADNDFKIVWVLDLMVIIFKEGEQLLKNEMTAEINCGG